MMKAAAVAPAMPSLMMLPRPLLRADWRLRPSHRSRLRRAGFSGSPCPLIFGGGEACEYILMNTRDRHLEAAVGRATRRTTPHRLVLVIGPAPERVGQNKDREWRNER